MAENKRYIVQAQENGKLMISQDVIASIVSNAVKDVDGVVGLSMKPGTEIADLISKKRWSKGIKIVIGDKDELYIDCNVIVSYGQSVVTIAKAVQRAVANALGAMTNITIAAVNVNVCGIIRK